MQRSAAVELRKYWAVVLVFHCWWNGLDEFVEVEGLCFLLWLLWLLWLLVVVVVC